LAETPVFFLKLGKKNLNSHTMEGIMKKRTLKGPCVWLYAFLVLCFLSASSVPADPVWQWGSEGYRSCPYYYPEGFIGCKWLNYMNGWVSNAQTKFSGWDKAVSVCPLCYQGAIATVMMYYKWPLETHTNGYFNLGDANGENPGSTDNCRMTRIDHVWNYLDIINFSDCEHDDPTVRPLSGCGITGYCNADHEICRLFAAAGMGCNNNIKDLDYKPFFVNGGQGYCEVLKSRLGFTGAKCIDASAATLADTLNKYVSQKFQPVLTMQADHSFVIDGVRDNAGVTEFHTLDYYNNCNHHTASWRSIANMNVDVKWYLYGLDPRRQIDPGTPLSIEYTMGDEFVCNTSNTSRRASIRLFNCDQAQETFVVSATSSTRISGVWSAPTTVLPAASLSIPPGCNSVLTSEFGYQVPTIGTYPYTCMKIAVSVTNTSGRTVSPFIQIQEYQLDDRLIMKYTNQEMGAITPRGNLELKTGTNASPVAGSGLVMSCQGVPMARLAPDGNLYCANILTIQADWLGNSSHLSGGLVFNTYQGGVKVPLLLVSAAGTMDIASLVKSPTRITTMDPIFFLGPFETTLRIGQVANISWEYDKVRFTDATVDLSLTFDDGRSSESILTLAVQTGTGGYGSYGWTVPANSQGTNTPMAGRSIRFMVEGYHSHVTAISDQTYTITN
jgi:hypothetical protein